MTYNKLGKVLIIALMTIIITDTLSAQRRTRTRTRERQEQPQEKLAPWFAISIGTLGFGSGFSISGKFSYAVKYENRISVGAYGKTFYDLINNFGRPDESLFSYGAGAFTRLNVTEDIFLQGEYSYTSFDLFNSTNRENILYPSIGGGYKAGYGDWTYGFHINLPLNDRARDFVAVEYWIDFNYKF